MSQSRTAPEILDREFLETRSKILQLAAALDRLDRAPGRVDLDRDEPRLDQIRRALEVLRNSGTERAEEVQMIFSDPYEPDWQRGLSPSPRR